MRGSLHRRAAPCPRSAAAFAARIGADPDDHVFGRRDHGGRRPWLGDRRGQPGPAGLACMFWSTGWSWAKSAATASARTWGRPASSRFMSATPFPLPPALIDGASHDLEFRHRLQRITVLHRGEIVEKTRFAVEYRLRVHSYVDGLTHGALRGWLVAARGEAGTAHRRPRHPGHLQRRARGPGRGQPLPRRCGPRAVGRSELRLPIHPAGAVPNRAHAKSFRFFMLPEMVELDNSPYVTSFVTDKREGDTLAIVEQIDQLHADLTRLRRQVRALLPDPGYTLADYDRWWKLYEPDLRRRVLRGRDAERCAGTRQRRARQRRHAGLSPCARGLPGRGPVGAGAEPGTISSLSSSTMRAASRRSRPCSTASPKATAACASIRRAKNGGISRATNDAIEAATGQLDPVLRP